MEKIHDQNEFLARILSKPIKTAVKKYVHDYYTKYIEITHVKYKMTSIIKAI